MMPSQVSTFGRAQLLPEGAKGALLEGREACPAQTRTGPSAIPLYAADETWQHQRQRLLRTSGDDNLQKVHEL